MKKIGQSLLYIGSKRKNRTKQRKQAQIQVSRLQSKIVDVEGFSKPISKMISIRI